MKPPQRPQSRTVMILSLLITPLLFSSVRSDDVVDLIKFGDGAKHATALLSDTIVTVTDVDQHAALALDVRDIEENLRTGDVENARLIYMNGRNSLLSNGDKRPLRAFGEAPKLLGREYLRSDVSFAFHMYGLANLPQRNADVVLPAEAVGEYLDFSHRYVLDALAEFDEDDPLLASEAAVSLSVWFHTVHKLWESVELCRETTRAFVDANGKMEEKELLTRRRAIKLAFDEAIAFYVGRYQSNGDADGYMLYKHAQTVGQKFNTADPEAKANADVKELYQLGRSHLSMNKACTENGSTENSFYHVVTKMTQRMMVPQMQSLIAALKTKDFKRVKLYATAVVPQIASCRYSSFRRLKQELLDRDKFETANTEEIINQLQSNYGCLGFDCKDVGTYLGKTSLNVCRDDAVHPVLAGYSTASNVRRQARIDLDVSQIRALVTLEADAPASLLYRFGRNSKTLDYEYLNGSLQLVATSMLRANVKPWFLEFKDYFGDQRYADVTVLKTLFRSSDGKWAKKSQSQRVQVVVKTLQYQVLFMFILAKTRMAISDCDDGEFAHTDSLASSWDQVAAFVIGSIEGPELGGGDRGDGQLLWNRANANCAEFGTCNADGYAESNEELLELFYAGSAQSEARDCDGLRRTVARVERLLMVPFLQGVLRYAAANEKRSDTSDSGDLASGETLALSLLPMIRRYDPDAAETVERNMVWKEGVKPVRDGVGTVARALSSFAKKVGIPCEDVGRTKGGDHVCDGDVFSSDGAGRSATTAVTLTTMGVVVAVVVAFS